MRNPQESAAEPSEPFVDLINMETAQIDARSEDAAEPTEALAGVDQGSQTRHDDEPVDEPAVEHTEEITDELIHQAVKIGDSLAS